MDILHRLGGNDSRGPDNGESAAKQIRAFDGDWGVAWDIVFVP